MPKSSAALWSAGRYDAIGERIAPIAAEVVAAASRRGPLRDVIDLACGTGNAALAAAAAGARVTGVDVTAELIAIGAQKAERSGHSISWVTDDAADTGLPAASFDTAVSNMGIIFVDPAKQVAEIARLLKPQGVLAFSAWVLDPGNPFFSPIVAVLGAPPPAEFTPDQWGDTAIIHDRLAADFDAVEIEQRTHTWRLGSVEEAMHFIAEESPTHVATFARLDDATRERLLAAYDETLRAHLDDAGSVAYDAPYVVVTALRRDT
ncbi:SAM-dependent methyltransferase [Mycolicibacterium agri]|uniref:SAM-dependent methyltransferase n=1 Tax=Mycolicibacterium agri TaxID=36811 RepID=A0A2A7N698_MYCAG|nr:class I SAM-dependent methyltransferase [Mycolicibacterium agri]PEG39396.1 SAM-dependent methyltransferase [Mycolicibacterium agri]